MAEFTGILSGILVIVVLYLLDRYLPKWFGLVPGVLYLIFILEVMITRGSGHYVPLLMALIVGELVLNAVWMNALASRRKKEQREASQSN